MTNRTVTTFYPAGTLYVQLISDMNTAGHSADIACRLLIMVLCTLCIYFMYFESVLCVASVVIFNLVSFFLYFILKYSVSCLESSLVSSFTPSDMSVYYCYAFTFR